MSRNRAPQTIAVANGIGEDSALGAVTPPLARAQQSGFGSMLSFELDGGTDAVRRFVETVELFTLAESFGGIESLVSIPPP